MNIFIVGPMGVGKSTISRHIAEILDKTFLDSDHEIEKRSGAKISLIFEYEGESGFRKREQAVINDLTAKQNIVLSTGGGVVLNAENRKHLQTRGYVIYLHAAIDELLKRTAHSYNRPLLQTPNRREKLEKLVLERHPLYQSIADVTIETGHRSIRQVIKIVLKHLKKVMDNENINS